jgi:MFS family permease
MSETIEIDNNKKKDQYYKKNASGISGVEFFWGLGLPLVIESTFLQLFIRSIGGSGFATGLIPSFFYIGCSVFALIASFYSSKLIRKRNIVVLLHIVPSSSLLAFGAIMFYFGKVDSLLLIFFICYAIFSLFLGMTVPIWLSYIVDIFSVEKSISGMSFMLISQNAGKIISSFIILKIVEKTAFSIESSALIFISVGLLFIIGSFFFYFTKEVPEEAPSNNNNQKFVSYTIKSFKHILNNKNYLYWLFGDTFFVTLVTIISFYAIYATKYCGIDEATASGMFVACIYIGAITANIIFGTIGILSIRTRYYIATTSTMIGIILLISFKHYYSFYLVSFLFGVSRGTRMLLFAAVTKKLSGLTDSTSYFAVSPLLTLPFSAGYPLLFGKATDMLEGYGDLSFKIMFGISLSLIFLAFYCFYKTDYKED